jgi:glycosidase
MTIPDWVPDAIFYQIFPDRFANGDPLNDPPNVQAWGTPPTVSGFQGGDLQGVIQRLDYLLDLGISAIYLNPIFLASSNHRYNTTDYFRVDPRLGKKEDLVLLLELAHRNGMRVILDGVFNHCGRGFFAFNDLLENEGHSPYLDWFHVRKVPVEAYGPGEAQDYLAWWRLKSLPKFNTSNPGVRAYLLDVARYWIDQGIDGWRLDVPNEINDDSFWAELRQVVKQANPEAYLFGEIWTLDPRWVGERHFDGVMSYPLRELILTALGNQPPAAAEFAARVEQIYASYPPDFHFGLYLTLGSHDTERIRTLAKTSAAVRLAFSLLFSMPGAPSIYYGDEIGLEGAKDPDSRRAFPWEPSVWDRSLRDHLQRLIRLRREHAALRRGEMGFLTVESAPGLLGIVRRLEGDTVVVVANLTGHELRAALPLGSLGWGEGMSLRDGLSGAAFSVRKGAIDLRLPGKGSAILVRGGPG